MSNFNPTEQYGNIRGFNFQPDWSGNGVGVWLKFDSNRYREIIVQAKKLFPGMNTLRIWLSFDAWCEDQNLYLESVRKAAEIIKEEGLQYIPTYFNGWFGIPVFGGFVPEHLEWARRRNDYLNHRIYLRESFNAVKTEAILLHDISNEPYNNCWGHKENTETVTDFLREMCFELRSLDGKPITIGSQGDVRQDTMGMAEIKSKWGDIDLLKDMVDVITLHPYCIGVSQADKHLKDLKDVIEYLKMIEKPVIITECCWAGKTDDERIEYLNIELPRYSEMGIGFLVHALSDSPVADLHPLDDGRELGCLGIYMAFMNKDGEIRKGHEIFNKL